MFIKILSTIFVLSSIVNLGSTTPLPQVLGDSTQTEGDVPVINYIQQKPSNNLDINISSKAALLIDAETNQILYQKNLNKQLPIASITKLMTALVFLDFKPDFNTNVLVTNYDTGGGLAHLKAGEQFKLSDVFTAALVASDNTAASILSRSTGKTKYEFKNLMNQKAKELGLDNTHFEEPTGLSEHNVSTVKDISRLIGYAASKESIRERLSTNNVTIHSSEQEHVLKNTNQLLSNDQFNIILGKTGYTEEAGNCLVTIGTINGRKVISVVLGSETENARFQDTKALYWLAGQKYII